MEIISVFCETRVMLRPVVTVLLQTTDSDLPSQFRQALNEVSVTVVRDSTSLQKEAAQHQFDAVVIETRGPSDRSLVFSSHVDLSHTLLITGSKAVLRKMIKTVHLLNHHHGPSSLHGKSADNSLESYLEAKMGDFVKNMRNGAAKNLYPVFISAVERPLIASVLRETRGNQLQAAELLGLNRNTLRKKIADLHIPLKHTRRKSKRPI